MMYRFLFLCVFAVIGVSSYVYAAEVTTPAKQAIVLDYQTGQVLFDKDADARMPTSSMSKVMTMLVVFDALKAGTIELDTMFSVSEKAWKKGGSKMFVALHTSVTVEDLIRGVIVQSGNDATIVLAQGIAGSEKAFAEMINAKAKALGMNDSHFVNASGWPDPEHYSTARDLAIMARALVRDYPDYYHYYGEKEFTYNAITQQNRNPLLYKNMGADGIKTGHTEAGGYGVIGSGVRDGRRVVMVVNGLEDQTARARESEKLLEWGLARFENARLVKAQDVLIEAPVLFGQTESVSLVAKEPVDVTFLKGARDGLAVKVHYEGPLVAPVEAGAVVGSLDVIVDDKIVQSAPIVTGAGVSKAGFFKRSFQKMRYAGSELLSNFL